MRAVDPVLLIAVLALLVCIGIFIRAALGQRCPYWR